MISHGLESAPSSTKASSQRAGSNRLAIEGGDPIVDAAYVLRSRWPRVEDEDVEAIVHALRQGLLTEMSARSTVEQFENDCSLWTGSRYALSANSGTAALHCALAGLEVSAGDEVIVPALSYIACAAAVIHQHAIPVFADVDPDTYNITAATVEPCITARTKVIMAVHLHGLSVDLDPITKLAARHSIAVLEDFSQAAGATYRGRTVGGIGDAGAASLMAGKNLPGAGEGGVMTTNSRDVRNRAASIKCFGEQISAAGERSVLHETFGWNYRINILSAIMASHQLFRLDSYNSKRIESAARLNAAVAEIPGFRPPLVGEGCGHVYHMYRFSFDPESAGIKATVDQVREALQRVFWAEGLPLVEFQNMPLPGHALLQKKVGFGGGAPWSCHGRSDESYDIERFPASLQAIQSSLVVGYPAQAPLTNPDVVSAYVRGFSKLHANFGAFERFACSLDAAPPWRAAARLF